MSFLEKFKNKIQIIGKDGVNSLIEKSNSNPVMKNNFRFRFGT